MKLIHRLPYFLGLLGAGLCAAGLSRPLVADEFRAPPIGNGSDPGVLVWDAPSADAKGSMPIGNGDIGLNVWVEPNGDLVFLIGKTDAWDENLRLLKLGKVRLKFNPPLATGTGFRQELKLHDGAIEIQSQSEKRKLKITLWVDANHPVIQVDAQSTMGPPLTATASFEPWRKDKRPISGPEYHATGFTSLPAISYPDTIMAAAGTQIGWYHRNVVSPWPASMKLQKLGALVETQEDPILNRTSGCILRGTNFVASSPTELKLEKPSAKLSLHIFPLTQITATPEAWTAALNTQADAIENAPPEPRWQAHAQWWNDFWDRSWIVVHGNQARPVPLSAQPWRIGMASDGGSKFGGTVSDAQILPGALSDKEIASLAATTHAGTTALTGAASDLAKGCTVAAWIKPAPGDAGRIIDKCTAGRPDGMTFDTYPGLSLRWIVGDQTLRAANCLTPNEWQHVAATVDAATGALRIYRNGKLLQEGDDPGQLVTRGYALQRFINACGGRGGYPIKFNGSIFVVDHADGRGFDADFRLWGGGYWWQNTRLAYWSMLEAGDFDLMPPLFDMFMRALPARQLATQTYYGHGGAFYPETQSFWGNYLDQGDLGYGTDRQGKPDGLTDNQYIRRYWQGGIEMVALMLDYYDHTQDVGFRAQTLLPFAKEIVTFFDQHWKRGADGKILFYPAQSLETWWDSKNPMPEIAGLRWVLPRLLALTDDAALRQSWQKTLADLPPVPTQTDAKTGITILVPGETFASKHNCENTELYAVFPYRLYTLAAGPAPLAVANATWPRRRDPENGGWQQNSIQAALLGHADEARKYVLDSASHHDTSFRFPAIWGPNYDWMPDQDHGTVLMSALQRMVLQYEGRKILLLPAWPKGWNAAFKLHAPYQTTVEGIIQDGQVTGLKVTPESRRADVVLAEPFHTKGNTP